MKNFKFLKEFVSPLLVTITVTVKYSLAGTRGAGRDEERQAGGAHQAAHQGQAAPKYARVGEVIVSLEGREGKWIWGGVKRKFHVNLA